jgi:multicomponent Na+:H+ antiporter subunit G
MSLSLAVLSVILQILGVIFLFAAALGLLRFRDPLQRMHAATKAGTIGAGLVLAGTVVVIEGVEGQIIGVLAILFLFLTAPIAGHLLGRAAYVSGAELVGISERDALKGVLARQLKSLEQRSRAMPKD